MGVVTDSQVFNSKPDRELTGIEAEVYKHIDSISIPFSVIHHLPADTIADCHEIEKYLDGVICKNLFLKNSAKTSYTLLLMSPDKKFQSSLISKKLGSTRLSFASEEDMNFMLGVNPGSVSILALIRDTDNKIRLVVDEDLLKEEYFCCHPCRNTSTMKFKTDDIFNKFLNSINHDFITIEI